MVGRAALFTRDKVRDLVQADWVCNAKAFRELSDWTPRVSFDEGVERTVADYRRRGWLR